MKPGLAPGHRGTFSRVMTQADTVPALFPDATHLQGMPGVLATAKMIGLMEWACVEHLLPYYDEGEVSLGIHVDVNHIAATPPGMKVTVETEVEEIDGRFIWFRVRARDEHDVIGEGRHRRAIVAQEKFEAKAAAKAAGLTEEAL
ncbi:thioesterase family protein [Mesobacterium pallidum]|uniref:thioesterase family protein n=1 Tax=Mesobacterium pallidum TaxID=2872037 RepID=UPI001EE347A6|nr:thioesterase family protein [Mesobacterium pallidum]